MAPFCNTLPSLEDGRRVNQGRSESVPFILPPGSPLVSTYQQTLFLFTVGFIFPFPLLPHPLDSSLVAFPHL